MIGVWDWKFQASDNDLIFLVTSHHPEAIQEPTKTHLIRTKDIPVTQKVPRDLGALCQESVKDQILEQKMLLVLLSLRTVEGF